MGAIAILHKFEPSTIASSPQPLPITKSKGKELQSTLAADHGCFSWVCYNFLVGLLQCMFLVVMPNMDATHRISSTNHDGSSYHISHSSIILGLLQFHHYDYIIESQPRRKMALLFFYFISLYCLVFFFYFTSLLAMIGLVNRIQRVYMVLGDYGGDGKASSTRWKPFPTAAVVGKQIFGKLSRGGDRAFLGNKGLGISQNSRTQMNKEMKIYVGKHGHRNFKLNESYNKNNLGEEKDI